MKTNEHKNNYWDDIPYALRYLCLAQYYNSDPCCTRAVLNYLNDHMDRGSSYSATPYESLVYIVKAVESCLFPLDCHDTEWLSFIDDIAKVFYGAESMLAQIAPSNIKQSSITPEHYSEMNLIEIFQKLEDVYFSVLYMYTKDFDKLKERLNALLNDSEQNVKSLLGSSDAKQYIEYDDIEDCHYPGKDVWQPINWVAKEFIPGYQAKVLFVQYYEKYVLFLKNQSERMSNNDAASHMYCTADKLLMNMYGSVMDDIKDTSEDSMEEDAREVNPF